MCVPIKLFKGHCLVYNISLSYGLYEHVKGGVSLKLVFLDLLAEIFFILMLLIESNLRSRVSG